MQLFLQLILPVHVP